MAIVDIITANCENGKLSQGTIARRWDDKGTLIQFAGYPEPDDDEQLIYRLIVWMKASEDADPSELPPIELEADQWLVSNVYTQLAQTIRFQLCITNEAGTYEKHSPIFAGNIGKSLSHNGEEADIDVSELFDPYKKYVDELVVAAGAVVIDEDLDTAGAAADAKATGDALAGLNGRLTEVSRIGESIGRESKLLRIIPTEITPGVYHFTKKTVSTDDANYQRIEYEIQKERYLYITGYAYSAQYGLYGFLDADGNVITYDNTHTSGTLVQDQLVDVPANAVKVIVNGRKGTAYFQCLKTYAETVRQETDALPSANVFTDLSEITSTKTTGYAKNVSGGTSANAKYEYIEAALSGGETLYISGCYFAPGYPVCIVYDDSDNIIYRKIESSEWHHSTDVIKCPDNARKVVVNGIVGVPTIIAPASIKVYKGEENLYTTLRKMGVNRRILFIGDSYCEGYSHDEKNDGWAVYCAEYMELTEADYVRVYKGGARFSANSSDNTFLALLNSTNYPTDYFTDVVVCGGYNDHAYSEDTILTAIKLFITTCKNKYPLAKIHIGEVAYCKQGNGTGAEPNWATYRGQIESVVIPAYQRCVEYDAEYLNNVEYWLNEDGLTPSDGYHPSEAGNRAIARAVKNALLTGSASLPYNADLRA